MIISRTPFRISFFGGGTDYPAWYNRHPGAVLATTINKYCYISCRYLPPFFDHTSRIIYSRTEEVKKNFQIKHPAVRECLRFMRLVKGVEIHHDGDLPARSGLGSSSAFTVGMLNVLHALKGAISSKKQLADEAIHIEQEILKENVGCQDQVLAAYGGLNLIHFGGDKHLQVVPVTLNQHRITVLQDHLILFFTGLSRIASKIAAEQVRQTPYKEKELAAIYQIVQHSAEILIGKNDLEKFGKLMHESWLIKRSLSSRISNPKIEAMYAAARSAGALGGKVLGAGGGGFMLFFARPKDHIRIKNKLKKILHVPFYFENSGSQIIFYNPQDSLDA